MKSGNGGLLGQSGSTCPGHRPHPASRRGKPRSSSSPGPPATALVMWLGELITQRGIGNGMSILIFASVVSSLPFQGGASVHARGRTFKFTVIFAHRPADDPRDRRGRVGPAPNPRAVRQTGRRPPHVRRPEHLHPAEGQPVGCDPGDLRELAALVPGDPRDGPAVERAGARPRSATTSSATARSAGSTSCATGC